MEKLNEKKESTKKAKNKLHCIEGFYPESELMEVIVHDENGNEIDKRYYLPLAVKETWFWLAYPDGAIRTVAKEVKENYVRAECKLYRNYKDAPEEFFVSAEKVVSVNYYDQFYAGRSKEEILGGYINAAKAGAESIALSKGGFGIQVESPEEADALSDKQYEQSLVRIPVPKMTPVSIPVPTVQDINGQKRKELDDKLPKSTKESNFVPYQPIPAEQKIPTPTPFTQLNEMDSVAQNSKPATQQTIVDIMQNQAQIKNEQTVGVVESGVNGKMSIDEAKNYVTTSKNPRFAGKTLGQIFEEAPLAVPYIAHTSEGCEREAAILLSKTSAETNAKLEQYLAR